MRHFLLLAAAIVAGCQPARQAEDNPPPRMDTNVSGGSAQTPPSQEAGGGEGASVTVDRASYSPDGALTFRVTNRTKDTLGYNPCSSRSYERQAGSTWGPHPEVGRMCTMEIRLLMPGETQSATTEVPSDATPGTWRLVLTLGKQRVAPVGARENVVRAVSAPFQIR